MIELEVVGIPSPQGSKSAVLIGGKARLIEGSSTTGREKHKSWRQGVCQAGRDWLVANPQATLDEPIRMWMVFRFPLPGSDKYRTLHTVKPDLSKIIRSTEDAIVDAGIIRDDSLVFSLRVDKFYCHGDATPGATIVIQGLGEFEAEQRAELKLRAKEARKKTP